MRWLVLQGEIVKLSLVGLETPFGTASSEAHIGFVLPNGHVACGQHERPSQLVYLNGASSFDIPRRVCRRRG